MDLPRREADARCIGSATIQPVLSINPVLSIDSVLSTNNGGQEVKKINRGFTLIELLVVLHTIGVWSLIAFPSYQDSVMRSRRSQAQSVLETMSAGMERFFLVSDTYVGAAAADVPINAVINLGNEDSTSYYTYTATGLSTTAYALFATPVDGESQDGDGAYTLTSLGVRGWDENDNSGDGYESSW